MLVPKTVRTVVGIRGRGSCLLLGTGSHQKLQELEAREGLLCRTVHWSYCTRPKSNAGESIVLQELSTGGCIERTWVSGACSTVGWCEAWGAWYLGMDLPVWSLGWVWGHRFTQGLHMPGIWLRHRTTGCPSHTSYWLPCSMNTKEIRLVAHRKQEEKPLLPGPSRLILCSCKGEKLKKAQVCCITELMKNGFEPRCNKLVTCTNAVIAPKNYIWV